MAMLLLSSFIFLEELINIRSHVKSAVVATAIGGRRGGGRGRAAGYDDDSEEEESTSETSKRGEDADGTAVPTNSDADPNPVDGDEKDEGDTDEVGGDTDDGRRDEKTEIEDVFSPPPPPASPPMSPAPPSLEPPSSPETPPSPKTHKEEATPAAAAAAAGEGSPRPSIAPRPFSPQFAAFLATKPLTIEPERGMRVAPALHCPGRCAHGGWQGHPLHVHRLPHFSNPPVTSPFHLSPHHQRLNCMNQVYTYIALPR